MGAVIAGLSLVPTMAFADYVNTDNVTTASNDGTVTVSKSIKASAATDLAGKTFTFHFEPVTSSTEASFVSSEGKTIPDVTLTFDALDNSGLQTKTGTATLPNLATAYSKAGLYEWIVTESAHTTVESTWVYSQASYKLRAYVENDGHGGYIYKYVTIERMTNDSGAPEVVKTENCAFENTNIVPQDLTLTKTITGATADMTAKFPITVTLKLPQSVAQDGTYTYSVAGGAAQNVTFANGQATINCELGHNESLVVNGIPAGTIYSAVETTTEMNGVPYDQAWTYTYAGLDIQGQNFATKTNDGGTAASMPEVSAGAVNTRTMVGEGTGNAVALTNKAQDIPITGVLMNNLPYVVLVAAPVAAAIAYVALRRKQQA